jgi:GNAT superfamily N-acetyltransferase
MLVTLNDVAQNPENFRFSITIKNGENTIVRPLLPTDVNELTFFLQQLSPETRRLSTFNSYDLAMAQELCDAINRYDKLRFVLENQEKKIVGLLEFSFDIPGSDAERFKNYGITLSSAADCRFGPTLADDYQDKGVGSQVLPFIFEIAKKFGRSRMILFGGVLNDNPRAIRYYEKNGFTKAGDFVNQDGVNCVDMIKTL